MDRILSLDQFNSVAREQKKIWSGDIPPTIFLWHKHQFHIFLHVVKSQHHSPTISNFCRNDHLIFSKEIGLTMIIYTAMFSNCDSHPSLNVGSEKFIGVKPVSLADGTAWVLLVNMLLYLACCLPIATVVWCGLLLFQSTESMKRCRKQMQIMKSVCIHSPHCHLVFATAAATLYQGSQLRKKVKHRLPITCTLSSECNHYQQKVGMPSARME